MVEQKEIRKDAQLAREVQLSLPHELNFEQRKALVCAFVQREFVGRGMIADIAMHKPDRGGDQRNFHVHIMLTTREVGPDGFGKKNRNWNSREELAAMREAWAEVQNDHLHRYLGSQAPQVTHLSYADREEERVPTVHLGPTATAMERRGIETIMGDHNRDAARRNQTIRRARDRMDHIEKELNPQAQRSFGYVANEARLQARQAIDEKRTLEDRLRDVLVQKKKDGAALSLNALRKRVLGDTLSEIRDLKRRIVATKMQGGNLRKKFRSASQWVTNPARMIWLKIAELHQRDRLEAALRMAQMRLAVRQEWLASREGKLWMSQSRRSSDFGALRTEERKLRRHVRAADRRVNQALTIAKEADGLKAVAFGRENIPSGIELPESFGDPRKYLMTISSRLQAVQRALPKDLSLKLQQELSKGQGRSR
jgi:hypothetical protein